MEALLLTSHCRLIHSGEKLIHSGEKANSAECALPTAKELQWIAVSRVATVQCAVCTVYCAGAVCRV